MVVRVPRPTPRLPPIFLPGLVAPATPRLPPIFLPGPAVPATPPTPRPLLFLPGPAVHAAPRLPPIFLPGLVAPATRFSRPVLQAPASLPPIFLPGLVVRVGLRVPGFPGAVSPPVVVLSAPLLPPPGFPLAVVRPLPLPVCDLLEGFDYGLDVLQVAVASDFSSRAAYVPLPLLLGGKAAERRLPLRV